MRRRRILAAGAALIALTTSACSRSNLIDTPFPGVIVSASAPHPKKCTDQRCLATYEVTITNPTQKDANVLECHLDDGQDPAMGGLTIPVATAGSGVAILGGATARASAMYILPVSPASIERLVGLTVTCQGIDWHGNPPI